MRLTLAEVRPRPADLGHNLEILETCLAKAPKGGLIAFPELFLSGYSIGDRMHRLALDLRGPEVARIQERARAAGAWIVVGTPLSDPARKGEIQNVALMVGPEGQASFQGKRYLPTFGPFEEGRMFTPAAGREVVETPLGRIGLLICYEVFFPEVSRALAQQGADLLLVISASPVSSRGLFEKLLPARAIENATPVAYVNRVGVEDSLVFAGGSGTWDPRGEPIEPAITELGREGRLLSFELPLGEYHHYRPQRPVLRDITSLP